MILSGRTGGHLILQCTRSGGGRREHQIGGDNPDNPSSLEGQEARAMHGKCISLSVASTHAHMHTHVHTCMHTHTHSGG